MIAIEIAATLKERISAGNKTSAVSLQAKKRS
jgi:hypothetical protein